MSEAKITHGFVECNHNVHNAGYCDVWVRDEGDTRSRRCAAPASAHATIAPVQSLEDRVIEVIADALLDESAEFEHPTDQQVARWLETARDRARRIVVALASHGLSVRS